MKENLTKILAEFSADLRYEDLPLNTVRMAKQCILDWCGVALRGSLETPAQLLQTTLLASDTGAEATVLGSRQKKSSALNAAFLNGAASHTLDFDDLHNASIVHIATVVVPPALAVAEKERAGGRDILAAVVTGYELAARIGESVIPESYYFWHTTGSVGTIAAAAAASRALSLTIQETIQALGSAGTQAAGLWEFVKEGAMSKPLHTGKACYAGVLSAYLAKAGFTGASRILEGDQGFCRAMLKKPHFAALTDGLGEGFKIDENSFKPYPCCKHSHAAIYGAVTLKKEQGFRANDIEEVRVLVNNITDKLINNPAPQTTYGCKFSIQYCIACALCYNGNITLEQFTAEKRDDPAVRALMKRITVKQDAAVQAVYDADSTKLASKVIVSLKDGRVLEKEVDYPKGDPQNPMTIEECGEKFLSLAGSVIGSEKAQRLQSTILSLDEFNDVAAALNAAV